ncbi:MAG: transketolase [Proteobacteria bacterium]|nr:transketolase [Pseudomonadota bacterium]
MHRAAVRGEQVAALVAQCAKLRVQIIQMLEHSGSGHPGGSLSMIDLVASLYQCKLRHDPSRPSWPERDRFVLSKGHGVPALYVTLARHGYFDEAELGSLRAAGSRLQGHPVRDSVPGIESSSGSLGQGLSIAQGMALAARLDARDYSVYCLVGDGEIQEGQIWEAAMSAAKFGLDNLITIVDNNRAQLDGFVREIMPIEPIEAKWQAFGWDTKRIDGHDHDQILDAYDWAGERRSKPKVIVADTVKGKGVSFMEDNNAWHGVAPNAEQAAQAIREIESAVPA